MLQPGSIASHLPAWDEPGLATLRYRHPVDNNEKLALNCAQLHAMLLIAHA
jgi:hypothetical protein